MNSADLCRKNGWTVGTVLQSNEHFGPEQIVITAIGEESILAKQIGDEDYVSEHTWDLSFRDWEKVSE